MASITRLGYPAPWITTGTELRALTEELDNGNSQ